MRVKGNWNSGAKVRLNLAIIATMSNYSLGGLHSILLHGITLGGRLYTYFRFAPCTKEQTKGQYL